MMRKYFSAMKVSNKQNIEAVGLFLMFMIPVILVVAICHFMIIKKIDWIIIILIPMLLAIMVSLYTLHYKEFENSGYVITIKKKYPLRAKGFALPILEFPLNLLKEFHIDGRTIYLKLASSNMESEKTNVFKIVLSGFSEAQCDEITKSLSNIKED